MIFSFLSRFRRQKHPAASPLYAAAVAQARTPGFYLDLGLPDTPEGRYEALTLHVYLILRRLKGETGEEVAALSQDIFDILFHDMDESLREMGLGDLGISHRVKAMAKAFYGRIDAYDQGLAEEGEDALEQALLRNFYRKGAPEAAALTAMAGYLRAADQHLAGQPLADLLAGQATFPPVPARS